ncbi:MAG: class II aldolase/adducin family protein [Hyphomicrobiales bacterium]
MTDSADEDLRRAVIEAALATNTLGINHGTAGNVSLRQGDGFLITPSGVAYDEMAPGQIVAVGLDGTFSGDWLPSSEWRMHRDIYASRPEAMAVVHVHSMNATALACLRRGIPAFHYMVAAAGGDEILCAPYATFGTEELSRAMLAALGPRRACLLGNHGQIVYGPTLKKALGLAVEVEALAAQYLITLQAGTPALLDKAEMARVIEKFRTYGKQKTDI